MQYLPDALKLVEALHAAQQDVFDPQAKRKQPRVVVEILVKAECRVGPPEQAEDALLRLCLEVRRELLLGDGAHRHEDLSEEVAALLLLHQRLVKLGFRDATPSQQELAESLRWIVGRASDDLAFAHEDPFAHTVTLQLERAGLACGCQPLQQVG